MDGLRALLLFEPDGVKVHRQPSTAAQDNPQSLGRYTPAIIEIYRGLLNGIQTNNLKTFAVTVKNIDKHTGNDTIRQMSKDCLKSLSAR